MPNPRRPRGRNAQAKIIKMHLASLVSATSSTTKKTQHSSCALIPLDDSLQSWLNSIPWNDQGLIEVNNFDANGTWLNWAWINCESLQRVLISGYAHYFSHRHQQVWRKGAQEHRFYPVRRICFDEFFEHSSDDFSKPNFIRLNFYLDRFESESFGSWCNNHYIDPIKSNHDSSNTPAFSASISNQEQAEIRLCALVSPQHYDQLEARWSATAPIDEFIDHNSIQTTSTPLPQNFDHISFQFSGSTSKQEINPALKSLIDHTAKLWQSSLDLLAQHGIAREDFFAYFHTQSVSPITTEAQTKQSLDKKNTSRRRRSRFRSNSSPSYS